MTPETKAILNRVKADGTDREKQIARALRVAMERIESQPHERKCHTQSEYPFGDKARKAWDAKGCDCWKVAALAAITAELEEK